MAKFTRHVPADVLDQANPEVERLPGVLRSDRRIGTGRAGVQPARRIIHIAADRERVLDHFVSELAVNFPEVGVVEGGVAVWKCRERRPVSGNSGSSCSTKVTNFL